jgi:hypothetical protein
MNVEGDERRRCGINYFSTGPAASGIMNLASHALTDVAINYRSFGPGAVPLRPQSY